jgi:fido (protein-threonine AMPylation protein)
MIDLSMKTPIYRLERTVSETGKPAYYLVKDFRVKGSKGKVTKYIGSEEPSPQMVEELSLEHSSDIELKAVDKKAEMGSKLYKTDLLPPSIAERAIKHMESVKYLVLAFKDVMTAQEVEIYEEGLEIDYVHGTTSIEGNTFDRSETRKLLTEGTYPPNKGLREINEIQNFRNVARFRNKYRGKVTLDFIKKLHALIMNNIDLENAGTFRRTDGIGIMGRDFMLTPWPLIEEELKAAIDNYYERINADQYPFFEALVFHHRFERIHPFIDGNGRVGREILNYMLMNEKFPRLLFVKDREVYLKALAQGDDSDYGGMVLTMTGLVIDQRAEVARRNMEQLSKIAQKGGQTRLIDFGS